VKAPADHPAAVRFALTVAATACAALLVFAAPASAKIGAEAPATPDPAGESSLPTEVEAPAPSETVEAAPVPDVPQTEEVTEAATETVDPTEAAAAAESVDATIEKASASTPEVSVPTNPSPEVPTADLPGAVRATAEVPSAPRVSRLADDTVDVPVKQLPDVEVPRGDAISLASPTSSGIGEDRSPALGSSPQSSHDPAPVGAPHFSMPPLTGPSSLDGETDAPLSPLAKYSGEPGGFEAPSLATVNGRYLEGLAQSTVASAAASGEGAAGRLNDPAPLDGPVPLPGAPTAAVSSSGDAFFVPIASLLALLALVAPAIFRRLREVPNFPAPTPFVCALERPG